MEALRPCDVAGARRLAPLIRKHSRIADPKTQDCKMSEEIVAQMIFTS
jgi:hypothetical protein